MKKAIIIIGIILTSIIIFFISAMGIMINKDAARYKKHLGETYMLEGDTLIVKDYSVFNESLILSNGKEVCFKTGWVLN